MHTAKLQKLKIKERNSISVSQKDILKAVRNFPVSFFLCHYLELPNETRSFYGKKERKPKVFVEGTRLDFDYMQRQMKFIDFVNDPAASDVHIIISQRVNGGGRVYSRL